MSLRSELCLNTENPPAARELHEVTLTFAPVAVPRRTLGYFAGRRIQGDAYTGFARAVLLEPRK